MKQLDLTQYGIVGTTEIVHNPSYEVLFAEETKAELTGFDKGQETELGAVNVMTGVYTERKHWAMQCLHRERNPRSHWALRYHTRSTPADRRPSSL